MFETSFLKTFSVSELTGLIKSILGESFHSIRVKGEVSNCRPSAAGHIYFTLKDEDSVISVALFRRRASQIDLKIQNGMQVVIAGNLEVYPPRGSYQIIVEDVEDIGEGSILKKFERCKKQLAEKGFFEIGRKKELPLYPGRVAVITSPTGAAIRDIIQVISRRDTAPHLIILPTLVQGPEAAAQIASQIRRACTYRLGEVIILARGGGSLEDLMCFNDEKVVEAIAEAALPLISGVGHETDVTLADLAADVRAATPSTAAELVSDRTEYLLIKTRGFREQGLSALRTRLEKHHLSLKMLTPRNIGKIMQDRLYRAARESDGALRELKHSAESRLKILRHQVEILASSIRNSSPASILQRGYARVSMGGKNIDSVHKLKKDDEVVIDFHNGSVISIIIEKTKKEIKEK